MSSSASRSVALRTYDTTIGAAPFLPATEHEQRPRPSGRLPRSLSPAPSSSPPSRRRLEENGSASTLHGPVSLATHTSTPDDASAGDRLDPSAAVSSSFDLRDPRDRRASSAIALLERHHSSVLQPYDEDDLISEGDERSSTKPRFFSAKHKLSKVIHTPLDDDERRDINDTVNTSENDYSILMTNVPRSDGEAPSPPRSNENASVFVRWRVLEFVISLSMMGVAGAFAIMPTHIREIPSIEVRISATQTVFARDPTLNNKKLHEQVPMSALMVGATGFPILVNLFMNFVLPKFKRVRVIPHDTRDFLLSLAQSAGISQLITHFIKNMTGRFRPSFYDMCQWDHSKVWDGVTNLCQDKKKEMEGRRSFPSGHSSYAFATLFLLTLYLMGRSRLNCENRDETVLRGGRKTLKLFLCFAPTLVAAWIAVTRSVDNWHHYADILAGSIIGVFAACFGYGYNYGSIFHWDSAGVPYQEAHVRRKKRDFEFQEASLALLNSSAHRNDGEPLSRSSATYATAPAPSSSSTKGDIAIHIQ